MANLAAYGASVLSDAGIDADTATYVHERISLAVRAMAAAILDNGIDVDLSAEFTVDFGTAGDGGDTEDGNA